MSINSCTTNCHTIDTICTDRRQAIIQVLLNKLAASIVVLAAFPTEVSPGALVDGDITITNNGPNAALNVTYSLQIPANLQSAPTISYLPQGATYTYNATTGQITFVGLPTTLSNGQIIGPFNINYVQPDLGSAVTFSAGSTSYNPNPSTAIVTTNIAPRQSTKGHPSPGAAPATSYRRQDNEVDTDTLEQSVIAVTVTLGDQEFTQSLERKDDELIPMISVSGIETEQDDVSVSIMVGKEIFTQSQDDDEDPTPKINVSELNLSVDPEIQVSDFSVQAEPVVEVSDLKVNVEPTIEVSGFTVEQIEPETIVEASGFVVEEIEPTVDVSVTGLSIMTKPEEVEEIVNIDSFTVRTLH